jgi:hypothetical protein
MSNATDLLAISVGNRESLRDLGQTVEVIRLPHGLEARLILRPPPPPAPWAPPPWAQPHNPYATSHN